MMGRQRVLTSSGTSGTAIRSAPTVKLLRTSGTVHDGRTLLYRASKRDCAVCPLRSRCCTSDARELSDKVTRKLVEIAREGMLDLETLRERTLAEIARL